MAERRGAALSLSWSVPSDWPHDLLDAPQRAVKPHQASSRLPSHCRHGAVPPPSRPLRHTPACDGKRRLQALGFYQLNATPKRVFPREAWISPSATALTARFGLSLRTTLVNRFAWVLDVALPEKDCQALASICCTSSIASVLLSLPLARSPISSSPLELPVATPATPWRRAALLPSHHPLSSGPAGAIDLPRDCDRQQPWQQPPSSSGPILGTRPIGSRHPGLCRRGFSSPAGLSS
jgi:hypothetical protein